MENFKNELLYVLNDKNFKEISKIFRDKYLSEYTQKELMNNLMRFIASIQTISDTTNDTHQIVINKVTNDMISGIEYWEPKLLDVIEGIEMPIDFIPLDELLTYYTHSLEHNIEMLGDILWHLTFDGWTIEEQLFSINKHLN